MSALRIALALVLMSGCAIQEPPTEDEQVYIRHQRGVDLMNYENCKAARRYAGFPMYHIGHVHPDGANVPPVIIKMDLSYNNCRKGLGIVWVEYLSEHLVVTGNEGVGK